MPTNNSTEDKLRNHNNFIFSRTPTSSTDVINVGYSENGNLLLQMVSVVPNAIIENHRTVVSADFVKTLIDILCEAADYYPQKKSKKKIKIKTKSKE